MGASRMRCFSRRHSIATHRGAESQCLSVSRSSMRVVSVMRLLTATLVVVSVLTVSAQRGTSTPIWFEGARLIVGDGSAVENSAFLVEGETFTWVGKQGQRQPPQGATRVDLSGKTVMPSL